jgi:hypothetical protein
VRHATLEVVAGKFAARLVMNCAVHAAAKFRGVEHGLTVSRINRAMAGNSLFRDACKGRMVATPCVNVRYPGGAAYPTLSSMRLLPTHSDLPTLSPLRANDLT